MQSSTKKRPQVDRGIRSRKDNDKLVAGTKSKEDARVTESQQLRRAANAVDASLTEDSFFTQFRNSLDADKRELLSIVQKRQQDAINADAAFRGKLRAPVADALYPHVAVTSAHGNKPQLTAGKATGAVAASPAAAACPVAASGTRILQLSKQLLASYDEAVKAVDVGSDKLKDVGGRLGDGWRKDVEELRGLLGVGYRKAQDDIVKVLQGSDGDDGSEGRVKKDAQQIAAKGGKTDVFFAAGQEQEERVRFNVTQSLCDASRGVLRLSRSLPPELRLE
ncbi:uncharacterized protein BKCO1_3000277 [Diplodia corticola]|uniref:Uncharacterized protein n=1 Tax=Diplodia corticola TaxID=236234 RepID=A0A1J9RBM8_9PEZI|nr:uncharacterized protein BKCO1_3000277 [Diplodia corticola]OJD38990.1 hypothetical protein BKCO1_3000277 [Diplodia corticola]